MNILKCSKGFIRGKKLIIIYIFFYLVTDISHQPAAGQSNVPKINCNTPIRIYDRPQARRRGGSKGSNEPPLKGRVGKEEKALIPRFYSTACLSKLCCINLFGLTQFKTQSTIIYIEEH